MCIPPVHLRSSRRWNPDASDNFIITRFGYPGHPPGNSSLAAAAPSSGCFFAEKAGAESKNPAPAFFLFFFRSQVDSPHTVFYSEQNRVLPMALYKRNVFSSQYFVSSSNTMSGKSVCYRLFARNFNRVQNSPKRCCVVILSITALFIYQVFRLNTLFNEKIFKALHVLREKKRLQTSSEAVTA